MGLEGRGRLVGHIFGRAWEYSLAVMGLMAISMWERQWGLGKEGRDMI